MQVTAPAVLPANGERVLVAHAPVYRGGVVPRRAAARATAIAGVVLAVYDAQRVVDGVAAVLPGGSDLVVRDGRKLVGRAGLRPEQPLNRRIDMGGRDWTVAVGREPRPGLGLGWVALALGGVLTLLVALTALQSHLTERRAQALAALRMAERDRAEAEVRLQSEITANLSEGIMLLRGDGTIVYVNDAWERMFGWVAAEAVGRHHKELIGDPDDEAWRNGAREADARLEAGESWTGEVPSRRADGEPLWVRTQISRFAHPEHGPVLVALQTDVTEQRRAIEALAEAQERFERAFEGAPIGMALTDLEGRYVSVNEALCEITGHPAAALLGKSSAEVTHPEDRHLIDAAMEDLLARRISSHQVELRYLNAEGEVVWVSLSTTLLCDSRGSRSTSSRRPRTSPTAAG